MVLNDYYEAGYISSNATVKLFEMISDISVRSDVAWTVGVAGIDQYFAPKWEGQTSIGHGIVQDSHVVGLSFPAS